MTIAVITAMGGLSVDERMVLLHAGMYYDESDPEVFDAATDPCFVKGLFPNGCARALMDGLLSKGLVRVNDDRFDWTPAGRHIAADCFGCFLISLLYGSVSPELYRRFADLDGDVLRFASELPLDSRLLSRMAFNYRRAQDRFSEYISLDRAPCCNEASHLFGPLERPKEDIRPIIAPGGLSYEVL